MVLRDKIYNTIKERITSGKYAPGQPLDEKQIIEELRTSRTPFREAINALIEQNNYDVVFSYLHNIDVLSHNFFDVLQESS